MRRRKNLGATMVEYVLIVALIAVVAIVAMKAVGQSASDKLINVSGNIEASN